MSKAQRCFCTLLFLLLLLVAVLVLVPVAVVVVVVAVAVVKCSCGYCCCCCFELIFLVCSEYVTEIFSPMSHIHLQHATSSTKKRGGGGLQEVQVFVFTSSGFHV